MWLVHLCRCKLQANDSYSVSLIRHQELQVMAVRIAEVDAVRVVFAAVDFDAGIFKRRFDFFIIARG